MHEKKKTCIPSFHRKLNSAESNKNTGRKKGPKTKKETKQKGMPGTIILSSRNSNADRRNTHNDNDGGDVDGDMSSKKRKRSISSTIMNLFQGINMDRNKTVFSLGSRYAASTPSKDVSNNNNNNILNEKMAELDECNSRPVKRKRSNRDESTVGSDLTYRERRNHDIERGSIILYESDSNAEGDNTVTRPPVLPLLPIQRLRLLRQKQRLREQLDLIRWSRLQSSSSGSTSSSSSLGKDNQGESSQATDAVVDQQVQDSSFNIDDSVLGDGIRSVHRARVNTKPMDSSIRLESPRLIEKRRRQRPATGFRWSGSFEYDMSEYETRSSSQSDRVNDQVQPVTNDGRGKFGDVNVMKQKVTEKDEKEVTKRGSGDDVQPGRRTVGETTPDTSYLRASSEGTHIGNLTATQRDILLNGPKEPNEPSAVAHGKVDKRPNTQHLSRRLLSFHRQIPRRIRTKLTKISELVPSNQQLGSILSQIPNYHLSRRRQQPLMVLRKPQTPSKRENLQLPLRPPYFQLTGQILVLMRTLHAHKLQEYRLAFQTKLLGWSLRLLLLIYHCLVSNKKRHRYILVNGAVEEEMTKKKKRKRKRIAPEGRKEPLLGPLLMLQRVLKSQHSHFREPPLLLRVLLLLLLKQRKNRYSNFQTVLSLEQR